MSLYKTIAQSICISVGSTVLALVGARFSYFCENRTEPILIISDYDDIQYKVKLIKKLLMAEGLATVSSFVVSWLLNSKPSILLVIALKIIQYAILVRL